MKDVTKIMSEINLIKQSIISIERNSYCIGDWMPKKAVLRFFDYGDNQLRCLEANGSVISSLIGNRKFYKQSSIIELLEKNIKTIKINKK
jgi:hypothetical protein